MTVLSNDALTSSCKGEVDREAIGMGSRFSRTKPMTSRARRLRSDLTDAELKMWKALRRDQLNGLHFRRQHPVGPYTLDFYCPAIGLAIELDGGQHAEKTKTADELRTAWLMTKKIKVVRYWNHDVLTNLHGVLTDLLARVDNFHSSSTPSPALPLSGGGSTLPSAQGERS